MRNKWLDAALVDVRRMAADPSMEPARQVKLRKAGRELEKVRRSGKLEEKRVFRAVALVSELLLDTTRSAEPNREPTSVPRRAG